MGNITVYKLTTQDNKTRKGYSNECTWGEGVTHSGTGRGELCGPGYIHAYLTPLLAVLLNPGHANIDNPKLWECSVSAIAKNDNDLKVGAVSLTTLKKINLPKVTNENRVVFAILCAKEAQNTIQSLADGDKPWQIKYRAEITKFNSWSEDYLAGIGRKDRKAAAAAIAAAAAAANAANAAAIAATTPAVISVLYAAANAANAAARTAAVISVLHAAAIAASTATAAANAAAKQMRKISGGTMTFNLSEIAERAISIG